MLCFLETPVLRIAILAYYRRTTAVYGMLNTECCVRNLSDPCYMFISRLSKHAQLTLKHNRNLAKAKLAISIFFSINCDIFYTHIQLTARSTFNLFFAIILRQKRFFIRVGTCILSLNYPDTITREKLSQTQEFFLFYFSGIKGPFTPKSKVPHASNFTIQGKKRPWRWCQCSFS